MPRPMTKAQLHKIELGARMWARDNLVAEILRLERRKEKVKIVELLNRLIALDEEIERLQYKKRKKQNGGIRVTKVTY